MTDFDEILSEAINRGASDIHLRVGLRPVVRVNGVLYPLKNFEPISAEWAERMSSSLMTEWQQMRFSESKQVDLSYSIQDVGRFRVNILQQRNVIGMVLRHIPFQVSSVSDLHLPPILEKVALEPRGLILVTGTTGSGKSTTLAAMVDHINNHRNCHIITIEDPIEYVHRDKKSVMNQREVGVDTDSFAGALRAALRQDPDVILVGEMRDLETIETALLAAETGHLVMSTLHTLDATESIVRITSSFPPYHQGQVRKQLAGILKGIVSQRLIRRADGTGRLPAVEVLVSTARTRECIEDSDKTRELRGAIAAGVTTYGMQTFDQSLMSLLKQELITLEEALNYCTNPDDFALRVKGISSESDGQWEEFEGRKDEI